VFETYWRFAAERHSIYLKRLRGQPPPWTTDTDLQVWRFTNVFRAADRVSQHLIRNVIYQSGGSDDDEEVVFRVLLFKLFNSIPAWEEALLPGLGKVPSWRKFDLARDARILGDACAGGAESGESSFEEAVKPTLDQPPKRFEHYELVTGEDGKPVEFGRGAMGITRRSMWMRCPVTLKVISERYLDDESAQLRFLREARAAAKVRHSNVASVLHLGQNREQLLLNGLALGGGGARPVRICSGVTGPP
jgi:serine/threonine protein kinase